MVASLDGLVSLAVTVDMPPFSVTAAGVSANVTPGAASSSVSVSVAAVTLCGARLEAASPITFTIRSGSSVALSTALIVAVSAAFTVVPAANTIVASDPTV